MTIFTILGCYYFNLLLLKQPWDIIVLGDYWKKEAVSTWCQEIPETEGEVFEADPVVSVMILSKEESAQLIRSYHYMPKEIGQDVLYSGKWN
jgi:hypothetical protein